MTPSFEKPLDSLDDLIQRGANVYYMNGSLSGENQGVYMWDPKLSIDTSSESLHKVNTFLSEGLKKVDTVRWYAQGRHFLVRKAK